MVRLLPATVPGADFLMEYHLTGDHYNKTIVAGKVFAAHSFCISLELTTLAFSPDKIKHGIQHHIPTEGTPIYARARRLVPYQLATAKSV